VASEKAPLVRQQDVPSDLEKYEHAASFLQGLIGLYGDLDGRLLLHLRAAQDVCLAGLEAHFYADVDEEAASETT